MRCIVAGPPKTGNVWMKNILSYVYGLRVLHGTEIPTEHPDSFRQFVEHGRFVEGTVFHQHFMPSEAFVSVAEGIGCRLFTTIRNPYDTFVSLYHYTQSFSENFVAAGDPSKLLIGKTVDHPDVLEFLAGAFSAHLQKAAAWLRSGKSIVVRYEDLYRAPFREVKRVTNLVQNVEDSVISNAIAASDARVWRTKSDDMARHIRTATVGDWKSHLNEEHLDVFRTVHGDLIRFLGYDVH